MLLSGVLIVLFLAGCWLYCLTEAAVTPASAYLGWPKRVWITIIACTFIAGAIAWLVSRRSGPGARWPSAGLDRLTAATPVTRYPVWAPATAAESAVARHPAGRGLHRTWAPAGRGPDDDPEFLRRLDRQIRGE